MCKDYKKTLNSMALFYGEDSLVSKLLATTAM